MNYEGSYVTIAVNDPEADILVRMAADPDAYFKEARTRAQAWIAGHLEDVFGSAGRDFGVTPDWPRVRQD